MRRKLTQESIETILDIISEDWNYSKHDGKLIISMDEPTVDEKDYKGLSRLINNHNIHLLWIEMVDRKFSTASKNH